jgi:hypothetical protein
MLFDGFATSSDVKRLDQARIVRFYELRDTLKNVVLDTAGTETQRTVFAAVRQNRYVRNRGEGPLLKPGELLATPGVAATVIYRLAQTKTIAQKPARDAFYVPFVSGRVPSGVSPAAVLGAFRNFQAKLLGAWGQAVLRGQPPKDIVDLVELYARAFPEERSDVLRIFLATTLGGTIRPGGVDTGEPDTTLAAMDALCADVEADRVSLRAGLEGVMTPQ